MGVRKLRFSVRGLWFEYECTPEELPSIVEVLVEKFGTCDGGGKERPSGQEDDPPSFPTVRVPSRKYGWRVDAIPILLIQD